MRAAASTFTAKATDKNRAQVAASTVLAGISGLLEFLGKDLEDELIFKQRNCELTVEQIVCMMEEFVNGSEATFSAEIPNCEAQRASFYGNCTPEKDEFLIGWADRIIATSHHLVVLSAGEQPAIEARIRVRQIKECYTQDTKGRWFRISDKGIVDVCGI